MQIERGPGRGPSQALRGRVGPRSGPKSTISGPTPPLLQPKNSETMLTEVDPIPTWGILRLMEALPRHLTLGTLSGFEGSWWRSIVAVDHKRGQYSRKVYNTLFHLRSRRFPMVGLTHQKSLLSDAAAATATRSTSKIEDPSRGPGMVEFTAPDILP